MPPKRKRVATVGNDGGKLTRNSNAGSPNRKRSGSSDEGSPNVKVELMEQEKISAALAEKEKREATKQIKHIAKSRAKEMQNKRNKATIRIQCSQCPKIFRIEENFTQHIKMEHSTLPNSVKCDQCLVRCPNAKALRAHIENVHKRDIFECPSCKKQFVRNAHVLRHMAQKGCDGAVVAMYPCEICNAQFNRKDNLMVHLRLQHITRKEFSCKDCAYSTGNFTKLIIHRQKYHSESKIQQYECDHCGKVVTSRAAMCKHLEIHGEKKFACDVCGYSTFTIEVMRRHVLTHVQEKPYQCPECTHSFIQRSQLNKHMEKHDGRNACKVCKESFPSRNKLMRHVQKKHINLDQKQKNAKERAKAYLQSLSGGEPLSCEVCGRSYPSERLMRRHMQVHTLERPRRCMYCVVARAYVRGVQLVKHVRKSHPQVFKDHLIHVRQVLGLKAIGDRVTKSELEAVLNVLDAEAERIIEGYGEGVLYGGMQEADAGSEGAAEGELLPAHTKAEDNPLMSEDELAENLNKLLVQLIDKDLLECFGWPDESVDTVLEKVIENCGAKAADREKWSRVQRLRENAKHLFLYVIEDKNIARMLDSHTIDQIIKHILTQVSGGGDERKNDIEVMLFNDANVETVVENILPVE